MTQIPSPLWPLMLPHTQHGRDDLCAVSAQGVRVRFANGRERLCGTSGLWNANLGYGNPVIAQAAAEALRDASYLTIWGYENIYTRQAAAALIQVANPEHYGRVLFSTSGGAAIDMAMKLVRHYQVLQGEDKRKIILGLHGAYHGLTYGAFALTSAQLGQRMYGVDRRLVGHVHPNDPEELATVLTRLEGQVAALVIEPLLGTAAIPLDESYIAELLRLRREHGFLLVADEISTGFGRLGTAFFATQRWPEPPDVLITSKALTNGTLAASALIVSQAVSKAFLRADALLGHAETQAGTAVVGTIILATLGEMQRLEAVARSAYLSTRLDVELARIVDEEKLVSATTGRGCLRSLRLSNNAGTPLEEAEVDNVVEAIRQAGALIHPGPGCIQLLPALIYSDNDLDELLGCVRAGLAAYKP